MLWKMQKGIIQTETNTVKSTGTTFGTLVTTSGTASVKGTAVELITATAFETYWVTVAVGEYAAGATDSQGCVDILVGAATEEVLIPNLLMGQAWFAVIGGLKFWDFPLYIPAGTRIAAQAAGNRLSTTCKVSIWLYGGGGSPNYRVGSKVTTYGIGTVPSGASITPGASGTNGAWAEVTASTTEDHFAFVPSFQVGTDTTMAGRIHTVQIGVGAATEESISQDYWYASRSDESMGGPVPSFPTFQDVPSGTRLVMRASNNSAADADYNCAIHAVS